jgi:hypothetical protein
MAEEYTTLAGRVHAVFGRAAAVRRSWRRFSWCWRLRVERSVRADPGVENLGRSHDQPAANGARAQGEDWQDDNALPLTVDADKMERFGKASLGHLQRQRRRPPRQLRSTPTGRGVHGREGRPGCGRSRPDPCGSSLRRTAAPARPSAEYFDLDQRVVLIGNARVWQDDNVVSGDTITIYVAQTARSWKVASRRGQGRLTAEGR